MLRGVTQARPWTCAFLLDPLMTALMPPTSWTSFSSSMYTTYLTVLRQLISHLTVSMTLLSGTLVPFLQHCLSNLVANESQKQQGFVDPSNPKAKSLTKKTSCSPPFQLRRRCREGCELGLLVIRRTLKHHVVSKDFWHEALSACVLQVWGVDRWTAGSSGMKKPRKKGVSMEKWERKLMHQFFGVLGMKVPKKEP
ncbi:hypothetical protein HMI56_001556 [Coelomomyces lativittatus]|nr:hypothetical protein HMI56_001556 [Coelomomyces lativittatus]